MSRPQKIHAPLKAKFTDIIHAIADGKGVTMVKGESIEKPSGMIKAQETKPKKK